MYVVYMLFTRVILNRIGRTLGEGQPCEQAGFRTGFSTIVHTHHYEAHRNVARVKAAAVYYVQRLEEGIRLRRRVLRKLYSGFTTKVSPFYDNVVANVNSEESVKGVGVDFFVPSSTLSNVDLRKLFMNFFVSCIELHLDEAVLSLRHGGLPMIEDLKYMLTLKPMSVLLQVRQFVIVVGTQRAVVWSANKNIGLRTTRSVVAGKDNSKPKIGVWVHEKTGISVAGPVDTFAKSTIDSLTRYSHIYDTFNRIAKGYDA
ncbi:unnamed protein product [Heligmosomoides polygyrus]|uniref:WS_DGAT_C domain-containing protein n=1 Tax=Heligmosomoides polygyrus TaxID=6339 RepID=A0A3P8EUN9_HELPZ|nr:unnamed protein product [Heligmosomoides polygyrus]